MPVTESRRRTKKSSAPERKYDSSRGEDNAGRKRNRRRRKRNAGLFLKEFFSGSRRDFRTFYNCHSISLMVSTSLVLFYLLFTFPLISRPSNEPTLVGASRTFQQKYYKSRELVETNNLLYTSVYNLATERLLPPDQTEWPEYEKRPYELKSTYGPNIEACEITVVFTDPRLGFPKYDYGPGQSMWFALESIGAFAPEACVLLQTCKSYCNLFADTGSLKPKLLHPINGFYSNLCNDRLSWQRGSHR